MNYINQFFLIASVVLSLFFIIKSLKKSFNIHTIVFVLIALLTSGIFIIYLLKELLPELITPSFLSSFTIGLVSGGSSLLYLFIVIYPFQITGRIKAIFFLTLVPGLVISVVYMLIVLLNIDQTKFIFLNNNLSLIISYSIIGLYISASVIILLLKILSKNYFVIKRDLFFLFIGLSGIIVFLTFIIILHFDSSIHYNNFIAGITFAGMLMIYLLFKAIEDVASIDLKKIYVDLLYRIIIFIIMFIPLYYILIFPNFTIYKNSLTTMTPVIAVIYLFLFNRFIKPLLENLIWKGYKNLTKRFTEFLPSFDEITANASDKKISFWDYFYSNAIDEFLIKFAISNGYLFLLDDEQKSFTLHYSFGKKISLTKFDDDKNILKNLLLHHEIIDRKKLIFSDRYINIKEQSIKIMDNYGFEVLLPLFDVNNILLGVLILSRFESNNIYSETFLKALDIYRIQFQYQLSNGQFLEKVKNEKIIEHDKTSIKLIKSLVIPETLEKIDHVRIASFYIDNSDIGGDYFDSYISDTDKLIILTSDTGYTGTNSGKKYLQLYSILHGHSKNISNPETLLERANKILYEKNTGSNTAINAAATIINIEKNKIFYSSAGYNPLYIFSPKTNDFIIKSIRSVPLAVEEDMQYSSESIVLEHGLIGFIYSDGFITALNKNGELYPVERVKKIVFSNNHVSPSVLVRKIYKDLKEFIQDFKQLNDISFVLFRIN